MFIKTAAGERLWTWLQFIIIELFKVSLVSYLILYLIEEMVPGFVSYYVDLHMLLWVSISTGAIAMMSQGEFRDDIQEKKQKSSQGLGLSIGLGLAGAVLLYFQINELGALSWIIAGLTGLIIMLINIYFIISPTNKE